MLNFIKIIHQIDWISSKTKNLLRNAVTSIIRDTKLLENYLSYPSSSHEFPDDESQSKSRKFEQFESLNLCSLKHTCPPSEKSCLLEIVGVYLMHRRRKQLGYLWKKIWDQQDIIPISIGKGLVIHISGVRAIQKKLDSFHSWSFCCYSFPVGMKISNQNNIYNLFYLQLGRQTRTKMTQKGAL